MNKKKIYNDPIYGFITTGHDILFEILEHSYFQRLRRIKQLGLTHLVYPGAMHTRLQHSMGAMHLMNNAVNVLRLKGVDISNEEEVGVKAAILLHDIGHGPFSHALETSIVHGISHEQISLLLMERLNNYFGGKLTLAISIFQNKYHKKFLHQLVSGQLDMDRMDYLNRDSFFTGVSEGVIGYDRIIKMLAVANDQLVVEEKGIYSIEKFLVARRLMYWQVYLHKTVLAAEHLLINILKRAKELALNGVAIFATDAFKEFLYHRYSLIDFSTDESLLGLFAKLDDFDVISAIKMWQNHQDKMLSLLSNMLIDRKLYKISLQNQPISHSDYDNNRKKLKKSYPWLTESDEKYLIFTDSITNSAYQEGDDKIIILQKNGNLLDFPDASDQLDAGVLLKEIKKYFLCTVRL